MRRPYGRGMPRPYRGYHHPPHRISHWWMFQVRSAPGVEYTA